MGAVITFAITTFIALMIIGAIVEMLKVVLPFIMRVIVPAIGIILFGALFTQASAGEAAAYAVPASFVAAALSESMLG